MNGQAQPYRPLTSENAALVLIDHQVGLMTGVRDYSTGELKHNVVALAKAAKTLKLPIVVTTTARDSMWGPTFPELVEALPGIQIIDRSTVNAWDDPKVAAAIETTGRRKLIIAGISLEVCAGFPGHYGGRQGLTPRLCGRRCIGNIQRHETRGRVAADATGGRDRVGLRDPDGRDPEGQRAARSSRGLRRA